MCSQRNPGRWNEKRCEPFIILPSATFRQAEEIVGLLSLLTSRQYPPELTDSRTAVRFTRTNATPDVIYHMGK